jgi:hypothetical protein
LSRPAISLVGRRLAFGALKCSWAIPPSSTHVPDVQSGLAKAGPSDTLCWEAQSCIAAELRLCCEEKGCMFVSERNYATGCWPACPAQVQMLM